MIIHIYIRDYLTHTRNKNNIQVREHMYIVHLRETNYFLFIISRDMQSINRAGISVLDSSFENIAFKTFES